MEEVLATDGTMSDEQELATEGTISDEVDTTEVETTETTTEDYLTEDTVDEEQDELDKLLEAKKKKEEKAKKLLAERTQLKGKVTELETKLALSELTKQHWEIDQEAVLALKTQYPTLPLEDAVILWKSKQPKPEVARRTSSMVGSEARNLDTRSITNAELAKLDQNLYNLAVEKIQKWQLVVKG